MVVPPNTWLTPLSTRLPGIDAGITAEQVAIAADGSAAVAANCFGAFLDTGGKRRTCGSPPDPLVTFLGPDGAHRWTWSSRDDLSGRATGVAFAPSGDVFVVGQVSSGFRPGGRVPEGSDPRRRASEGVEQFLALLGRADGALRWVRAAYGSAWTLDRRGVVHLEELVADAAGNYRRVMHGFDVATGKPLHRTDLDALGPCAPRCGTASLAPHPTDGAVLFQVPEHVPDRPVTLRARHLGSDGALRSDQSLDLLPLPTAQHTSPRLLAARLHPNGSLLVHLSYYTPEDHGAMTALVRVGPDLRTTRVVHLPAHSMLVGTLGERAVVTLFVHPPPNGPAPLVFGATVPPPDDTGTATVLAAIDLDSAQATTLWAPASRQFLGIDVNHGRAVYQGKAGLAQVRLEEPSR